MREHKLKAMWSELKITHNSSNSEIEEIFSYVKDFEQTYSRFIKWNYLDWLNSWSISELDNISLQFLNIAKEAYRLSEGHFDITISPILEELGYWNKEKEYKIWLDWIEIMWNELHLNGRKIEFWSMWKWYIVDYAFAKLSPSNDKILIDFGWDIKFKWDFKIWLESPFVENEIIWTYLWKDTSLAASSWSKRKFNGHNHLISKEFNTSIKQKKWVFLSHPSSLISDIFSTAVFVSPLNIWIKIIQSVKDLEWMIIEEDKIFKSEWYKWKLFTKK